jgi:flagella basal body P-ring formation protein FlgA
MMANSGRIPALRIAALHWEQPTRRRARLRAHHRAHDAERDRGIRIAIAVAIIAFVTVLASRVRAEPLADVVRARLAPSLPAGLDVAKVYLPAALAGIDTTPDAIALELPRELHAGRPSIKLTVRGHRGTWVPVAISVATDVAFAQRALAPGEVISAADIAIERRALAEIIPAPTTTLIGATATTAIAAGAPIAARDVALPPPLPRGTQVAVDVRRGAVHIRGAGTLELSARPGEPATARLAATRVVVHGTLVAPATLVVGDQP